MRDEESDEMLPEYDFTGAEQGKYFNHFARGVTAVLLDDDVAKVFTDSKQVNDVLRAQIPSFDPAAPSLTRRERQVVELIVKGMSNGEIAAATGLRERSVKNLVSIIMRKLHCEDRVQLVNSSGNQGSHRNYFFGA